MKKQGNKKMPRTRQEIIDNPIPTCLFVLCSCSVVCGYWGCDFKNNSECVATPLKNKDVGIGIFLFPFFFMK